MKLAIKELKLNSATTIAMFDRATNRINVYLKTKTGKPARKRTNMSGWDIIQTVAAENNVTVKYICDNFYPSINPHNVSFVWH